MKKFLIIGLLALSIISVSFAEETKIEPKKFEVIFTIKYNTLTLEQASQKEKMIKAAYKDSCDVDVSLSPAVGNAMYFTIND